MSRSHVGSTGTSGPCLMHADAADMFDDTEAFEPALVSFCRMLAWSVDAESALVSSDDQR